MQAELIIRKPIILTEKSSRLREDDNKVIFEVHPGANKLEIKSAIEKLFKVGVVSVNTLNVRGKDRRMGRGYARRPNWKKAVVTLKAGDSIQFFDEEQATETEATEATAASESKAE